MRRTRLDVQLDTIFDHGAAEVTGPAGSGKTTWLRSWADTTQCADVAWLTLKSRHQDSMVLVADLVASVRRATAVEPPTGEVRTDRLVEYVAQAADDTGRRLVIVVDEAQSLRGVESCTVLRELVANGHDRFRVVLAGRSVPDAGLESLRRPRELLFFTATDLRLTARETAEIVRLTMRSEPSDDVVAAIHDQVDGWALGAALAGLALEHAGAALPARVEGIGGHRYFEEFFGSNVFAALAPEVQAFLLDTCLIPQLEPDLCAEISGCDDALAVLRELERDNVFIEWIGGRPPVFRYHALLRSWLREHLDRCDPRRAGELARHAASWYERRGRLTEAIDQRLAAGDADTAASLIVDFGPTALGEGRYRAIVAWIGALPTAIVTTSRALLILLAEANYRLGDVDATTATRALSRDLASRRSDGSPLEHFELTLEVQRGTDLHRSGRLEAAAAQGRRALSKVDLSSVRVGDGTVRFDDLLLGMDVASVAVQVMFVGEFAESARLARCVADAFPSDNRNAAGVRVRCLGIAALAELLRGARPTADDMAREARAICRFHHLDPIEVAYAEMVLLVVGPIDDRPALEAALQRRAAQVDLASHTSLIALLRGWSYTQSCDFVTARQSLDDADREMARIAEPGILASLRRRVGAMVEAGCDEPLLSTREREVLAALAEEGSRRDAAQRLHLSLNTIKTHARHAYRSLGAASLTEALARCEALGIELQVGASSAGNGTVDGRRRPPAVDLVPPPASTSTRTLGGLRPG